MQEAQTLPRDLTGVGKPHLFNMEIYIAAVEGMIRSDEVAMALYMLDNPPGYYRENPHPLIVETKRLLLRQLVTPVWYATQKAEYDFQFSEGCFDYSYPRAHGTLQEIEAMNKEGIEPTLVDLAPGNFWLPIGLVKRGAKFKYLPKSLNAVAVEKLKAAYPDIQIATEPCENTIFVAYEIIEHLWNTEEIHQHVIQLPVRPKTIMLSTPMYTFNSPAERWDQADLGHLRTYTKKEFVEYAMKHWPDYSWALMPEHVMLLIGKLRQ